MDIFEAMELEPEPADLPESPDPVPPSTPQEGTDAPLPAVQHAETVAVIPLATRNQIVMLARTLYTMDKTITAEAIAQLWPERATALTFGFNEDGGFRVPTPDMVIIEEYIQSEDFLDKLATLGVTLLDKDAGLSSKQIAFLALVTDISSPLPLAAKLKKVGSSWQEFQAWQKQDAFKEAFTKMGGDAVRAAIPLAELALAKRMSDGEQKSIEYGFLLTGHFDPAKNKQIDAQKLFGILLEIIDEKVKDPNERMEIGQALSLRGNRALEM